MTDASSTIIYTHTDEAPALATRSLLPIVEAFAGVAGVPVSTRDISLAGRILAQFPDRLGEQAVSDDLAWLGELAKTPQANIVKLPNISASIPQLKAAIAELQAKGHDLPDYPEDPSTDDEREIAAKYDVAKGSAVNPVLREGNSDRRAPAPVKNFAKKHPHSMGDWSPDCDASVPTMDGGDFFANEQSVTIDGAGAFRIELVAEDGATTVLKSGVALEDGEVLDGTFLSVAALREFLAAQVADAEANRDTLFSLHMKATMMKVSDPIIFGHGVRAYFHDVWDAHGETIEGDLGLDPDDGLGAVMDGLRSSDDDRAADILAAIQQRIEDGPPLAYVNSHKGITALHVPSDTIIDASMPAMIRAGGQMWNANDETQDARAIIPDSSYAPLYAATVADCKANGAFDPTTMGTVPNVGLMAKKAEEYGSHDKTFEIPFAGTVRVVKEGSDEELMTFDVDAGDIWRACQAKHGPIVDWVQLAVRRGRATGWPIVFWLDDERAHDAQLIAKVEAELANLDTDGLTIEVMNVAEATEYTLDRVRRGEDTISVTGNVLRDYLTDLFPILEVGTSAKMLSIVPLMNGGGLFETGAGGSAPKHVQQMEKEGHLRWDSLGEFLALAQSLDHFGEVEDNAGAKLLGETLDRAIETFLDEGRSPSRKVNEIDNRGSHYYLARYWADEIAAQDVDPELALTFAPIAAQLGANEDRINEELLAAQGDPVDLGGYYLLDEEKAVAAMRPSPTLNEIIDGINA